MYFSGAVRDSNKVSNLHEWDKGEDGSLKHTFFSYSLLFLLQQSQHCGFDFIHVLDHQCWKLIIKCFWLFSKLEKRKRFGNN